MAYLHFNYLLSNDFKAPVYEVGSVLLLGQLPLDKSYQVWKGFSLSFRTRKYLPFLIVPNCQRADEGKHSYKMQSLGKKRTNSYPSCLEERSRCSLYTQIAGLFFLQCFWICFRFFFFLKECQGMAEVDDIDMARQRQFYQETTKPNSRWCGEGNWMAMCTYSRMSNWAWRLNPKGSGCTCRKAPLKVLCTTPECTATGGLFKHLGNSGQKSHPQIL